MPDPQIDRLADIRRRHAEASTDWQFALTNEGEIVSARVIPVDDPYTVLTLAKDCTHYDRELVCHAHADQGFLLEMLDQAFTVIRTLRHALERRQPKPTNYAANCAMACKSAEFQLFMHVEHGVDNPSDFIRVENKVKSMLGIHSKKELDQDPDAAQRWLKLWRDGQDWNKRRARG
jgi:hypothetical protein